MIDPDTARAIAAIELKRAGESHDAYVDCRIFSSIQEASQGLPADDRPK